MSKNRLYTSLAAAAAVVLFALPAGSAFAKPSVDLEQGVARSSTAIAASAVRPPESRDRVAYYLAKERQAARAAEVDRRMTERHPKPTRVSVAAARLNRYTTFKERQIERIMNGE